MTDLELNEAVARKLGWTYNQNPDNDKLSTWTKPDRTYGGWKNGLPAYSTSIEAAWEIVSHLQNHSINLRLTDPLTGWYCSIFSWEGYPGIKARGVEAAGEVEAEADTAPRAIAMAFLKLP